jgi:ribosomal protein S18 acetylase RimI-like enzyme
METQPSMNNGPVAGRASGGDRSRSAALWAPYQPDDPPGERPADLIIREAEIADCPVIAGIEAPTFGLNIAETRLRCESQVADPETFLLVAEADGEVIGFARAARLRPATDASPDTLPPGWYLTGLAVIDAWRRSGVGRELTYHRLRWVAKRARRAYYFTNTRNRASLDLHAALGFVEISRRFSIPNYSFGDGEGVLCRLDLRASRWRAPV